MDRQYYGLKALFIGVAIFAAVLGCGVEGSRLAITHNSDYQAAYVAQSAVYDASVKLTQTVGHFFARALADL
jgi:hypothetical protein